MNIHADEFFGKDLKVYDTKMSQEEHLLCEIEEFKLELEQSKVRMRHIERFIRAKETELHYLKTKSSKNSLYSSLYNHGAMIENFDTICETVKNWLPNMLDGGGDYSEGWNDCLKEILRNL